VDQHLVCSRCGEKAQQKAENVRPIIDQIMRSGAASLRSIAAALTARGIKTARGRSHWHAEQISAILRLTDGLDQLASDGHRLNAESVRRMLAR
jgi:hypothetical protein